MSGNVKLGKTASGFVVVPKCPQVPSVPKCRPSAWFVSRPCEKIECLAMSNWAKQPQALWLSPSARPSSPQVPPVPKCPRYVKLGKTASGFVVVPKCLPSGFVVVPKCLPSLAVKKAELSAWGKHRLQARSPAKRLSSTSTFTGPRRKSLFPKAARPAAPCATYCYVAAPA